MNVGTKPEGVLVVKKAFLMSASLASAIILLILLMQGPKAHGQGQGQQQKEQHPTAKVSWRFKTQHSKSGDPKTDVTLYVGGRPYLILHSVVEQFSTVSRSEYREKNVPAKALAACSGWWGGSGDDLYVVEHSTRHSTRLDVYRRAVDADIDAQPYKLIKSITGASVR